MVLTTAIISLGLIRACVALHDNYTLVRNYTAPDFFDHFDFFSEPDPTHGFVQYVDMATANNSGLAGFASSENFENLVYLGVDWWNATPSGRPSTRIESKDTFNHSTLWVADVHHMPGGLCGTWPAYWLLGTSLPWPQAGEIDIIEGINNRTTNTMALHTDRGVSISNSTNYRWSNATRMRGNVTNLDCSVSTGGNTGCVVEGSPNSFGGDFNANGGAVIATEYTRQAISVWNFDRSEVPSDALSGSPCPSEWRTPDAYFSSDNETLTSHFFDLKIIVNTALCGDWVNSAWSGSDCVSLAPTCTEYVANSPSAFKDAYWLIGGIQVYQFTPPNSTVFAGRGQEGRHHHHRRPHLPWGGAHVRRHV